MTRLFAALALLACGSGVMGDFQDCKDYVACSYRMGATPGSLDSKYGANGSCWQTSSSSDNCTAACRIFDGALKSSGAGADAGCTFAM
jgi:hypothetical protein